MRKIMAMPPRWASRGAKPWLRSQSTPALRATTRACFEDAAPFLNRLQQWRMRAFLWLYALTRQPMQRAFEVQTSVAGFSPRNEGIARLYLGCRQSLAFANHFPLLLAPQTQGSHSCAQRASGLVWALAQLAQGSSKHASVLSTSRQPGRHCDMLSAAPGATHFALLRRGVVFTVALADVVSRASLRQMVEEVIAYAPDLSGDKTHEATRLGELTALPREKWLGLQTKLLQVPDAARAMTALNDSAFVVCLDDEAHPSGIQALGRALRLENINNRYFDKSVQCIVFGNGEAGLLCDHGAMDGVAALQLAEALEALAKQSEPTQNSDHETTLKKMVWSPVHYCIPTSVVEKADAEKTLQTLQANRKSAAAEWKHFDHAYFASKGHCADSLIQLAIALSFFRCTGKHASMFEPVSLAHLQQGRLDFVSPVSGHSVDLIQGIGAHATRSQLRTHLAAAVAVQRQRITRAKQGLGHIGHMLALSALEVPHNRARGVARQKVQEAALSKLDSGMALLIKRDIVASNGGRSDAVRLFGTVVHKDNMIGVGYMNGHKALVVDIQATGQYAPMVETFKQELRRAIADIGSLAEAAP